MSTKSTFAPQYKPQFELATKVLGTVQRKSPGLRSNERHDKCKPAVAFDIAIEYFEFTVCETLFSNFLEHFLVLKNLILKLS